MMEYNDIGIKETDDIFTALKAGASAVELHQMYGSRISGLIAHALDVLYQSHRPVLPGVCPAAMDALRELHPGIEI